MNILKILNLYNITYYLACHGTGLHVAEKIAETGFAALSIEDDGYYGKGIYCKSLLSSIEHGKYKFYELF
jgi:hypothetical protein